jgi:hypothetical protein
MTGATPESRFAGASADEWADEAQLVADRLAQYAELVLDYAADNQAKAARTRVGAEGERLVASRLEDIIAALGASAWHLLADRRWPGRRTNLDLLVVGPPGVVVIDAKNMAEPRIENGSLFNGQDCEDEQVQGVRDAADAVASALAESGVAPTVVVPLVVLARQSLPPAPVRGVQVVGLDHLHRVLTRLGVVLTPEQTTVVRDALDASCPPKSAIASSAREVSSSTSPPTNRDDLVLFERDDLIADLVQVAAREPMEAWMTWLHPTQAQLVTRSVNGPIRIRGVAGSGKTVVALHRAAFLARDPSARILVTTFVRTLPQVQRSLLERLAPARSHRVEFLSLHAWARRLLTSRGIHVRIDADEARSLFLTAWASSQVARELYAVVPDSSYWRDEVAHVIKGRGLADLDEYLALERVGRRTPLRAELRTHVWTLYERYQLLLRENDVWDWDDVVDAALASVRGTPPDPAYTAAIVDEAQDLSCQGMRLLHALVGDRPDGLLVVGDGQQAVYPGGYTLKEAGVSVTGRSTVLTRNYRNGSEILRAALEVVGDDEFTDLDVDTDSGARGCETERPGGVVRRFPAVDRRSQRDELLADLRIELGHGVRAGDIALLCRTNSAASEWRAFLQDADIQVVDLAHYDGHAVNAVKVGTYQRAKGLEFAQVYVPDSDSVATRGLAATSDRQRERDELDRRCLFVAMTRARDRLWLGSVAGKPITTEE